MTKLPKPSNVTLSDIWDEIAELRALVAQRTSMSSVKTTLDKHTKLLEQLVEQTKPH